MAKKTAMQGLIDRIKEASLLVQGNKDYDNGYFLALSDTLALATTFLETEKQQIIEAHKKGQLWNKSGYNPDEAEQYYNETFEQ